MLKVTLVNCKLARSFQGFLVGNWLVATLEAGNW